MKKLVILGVVAACIAGGWFGYKAVKAKEDGAPIFERVELQRQRMEMTVEATGIVEPRNRIEIKPPVGGRIEEALATEGQAVKEGEVIAWMSSTERAALLDAARSEGDAVLQRWKRVYRPTPIIAPLEGTIIARKIEPGQTITAQDAAFVLSDRLVVKAQVDETDIGSISVGGQVKITPDAYPEAQFYGTVRHIAFEAITVNNVTIYEVEVEPKEIPARMKSGMTANAAFVVAYADDVPTLPADAVTRENGKAIVLVDDGAPRTPPQRTRVITGLAAGGRVEILAGLEGGEIVVKQTFKLSDKKDTASPFMPSRKR